MTKAIELSQLGGLLTTSDTAITVDRTIKIDEPSGNTATLTVQTQTNSGNDALIKIRGARTAAPDNDIAMLQFDNKTSSNYTMATISARDFAGDHTLEDGSLLFRTSDNGTLSDSMTILSGGLVGIGTTEPKSQLHADTSNTTSYPFSADVSGTYAYWPYPQELFIRNTSDGTADGFCGVLFNPGRDTDGSKQATARITAIDSGNYKADIAFGTRNTNFAERMRIRYDGNVGIGITNPSHKLHVLGTNTSGVAITGYESAKTILIGNESNTVANKQSFTIRPDAGRGITLEVPGNDASDGVYILTDPSDGGAADTIAFKFLNSGHASIETGYLNIPHDDVLLKFDQGQKMITSNDGQGNWNFRAGHDDSALHVDSTSGTSGLACMTLDSDGLDGAFNFAVGPRRTAGSSATFDYGLRVGRGLSGLLWTTGSSTVAGSLATTYKVWHAGNHGTTSGLDADKLDGQEGTYYTNRVTTTALTSADDLNSLTDEGWYRWSSSNPTNSPSTYGVMWMISDTSQLQQLVQTYGGNVNSVKLYGRRKTSGSWDTTWTEYWSNVNDGDASGLNADKLDDLHASSFLRSDATTVFNCSGNDFQFDYDTSRTLVSIRQLGTEKLRLSASSNTLTIDTYNSGALVIATNLTLSSVTTPITTNSIQFNNTEMSSSYYTEASGVLAFDENFSVDAEYGTDAYAPRQIFTENDGGGLLIKNEDGWGAVFTSQNTRFATPVFAGITSGVATFTKDGAFAAKIGGNGGGAYFLELGQLSTSSSPGINATGTSASLRLHINGSEKMRIGPTGNVGIGTNDPNAAKLQVWGTSAFGGTASTSRRTDIDTNGKVKIRFDDNNNTDVLTLENRATNASLGHGASIKWNFGDSSAQTAHSAGRIAVIQQTAHTSSTSTHDTEMRFSVANNDVLTDRMEIKCNGIVKFGTEAEIAPSEHIEVGRGSGSVSMTMNDGYGNANIAFNHRDGIPDNSTSGQSSSRIETAVDGTNARMYFELKDSVTQGVAVTLTEVLDLDIGLVEVTGALDVSGSVSENTSDGRLKENLVYITNPLDKVDQLHGYTFDWKSECADLGFTPKIQTNDIGLIAQDVQAVMPQAVTPAPFDHELSEDGTEDVSISGESYLTVQYQRLVPLLVEAIKELRQEVESLKSQIGGS